MTLEYWQVGLIFTMVLIWGISISSMIRTLDASPEKKTRIAQFLKKVTLSKKTFFGLKRSQSEKGKQITKNDVKRASQQAIANGVFAVFVLCMGIYFLNESDKFVSFFSFAFTFPALALSSIYYAFLWKLLSNESNKRDLTGS